MDSRLERDATAALEAHTFDAAHDVKHALRVLHTARQIAKELPEANLIVCELAALLHDAFDHKAGYSDDQARIQLLEVLTGLKQHHPQITDAIIERTIETIQATSFSKGKMPATPEQAVLRDADFLDATGAIGVARCFAYGGTKGRDLDESIRHFDEKLEKLYGLLTTEAAKKVGRRKHEFLLAFKREFLVESGQTCEQ